MTEESQLKETKERQLEDEREEIVDDCMRYETIDGHIVCEIVDLREKENEGEQNKIILEVDVPYGERTWNYDKPYEWSGTFPNLVESLGYGQANFHKIVGEDVLVEAKSSGKYWTMNHTTPSEMRRSSSESTVLDTDNTKSAVVSLLLMCTMTLMLFNLLPISLVAAFTISLAFGVIIFLDI